MCKSPYLLFECNFHRDESDCTLISDAYMMSKKEECDSSSSCLHDDSVYLEETAHSRTSLWMALASF